MLLLEEIQHWGNVFWWTSGLHQPPSLSIVYSNLLTDLCASFTVAQYPVSHMSQTIQLCLSWSLSSSHFTSVFSMSHTYVCLTLFVLLSPPTTCLWLKFASCDSRYSLCQAELALLFIFLSFFFCQSYTFSQCLSSSPPSFFPCNCSDFTLFGVQDKMAQISVTLHFTCILNHLVSCSFFPPVCISFCIPLAKISIPVNITVNVKHRC